MNIQSPPSVLDEAPSAHVKTAKRGRTLSLVPQLLPANRQTEAYSRSFHSTLFLFETLLSYGQTEDPRVVLQALNGYINARQQAEGIELFEGVLAKHRGNLSADGVALYLSGLAILRATHADRIPLLKRIGWVTESFAMLDQAFELASDDNPIVHWAAGMIYSQVPPFFFKKKRAYKHLHWLVDHPETEPVYGFYREVFHALAKLYRSDGNSTEAQKFFKKSGYEAYQPKALLMGWFTNGPQGTAMTPEPVLEEVVRGRVFALFGFGFSDIYFVLSDNGRELIAIDAGTTAPSLKAAHEFLLEHYPGLPQVSTVIVTHSHWDHIGGIEYFKQLNPAVAIYGRDNFRPVVDRVLREHSYTYFRGNDFDHGAVENYALTEPVSQKTEILIGDSRIVLIPVTGGETEDALLIHFPALDTVFVGDIVMPWYGEPWVNEGFIDDALATIEAVLACDARHVLHGHHPLTMMFGTDNLKAFRRHYSWLVETTKDHAAHGFSTKDIIRLNLVPPDLVGQPELYLPYSASRDSIIARTVSKMAGIWREDRTGQSPGGLDVITSAEHGRMLEIYLGLSSSQVAGVLKRMLAHGDNELALQFAVAAEQRYGAKTDLISLKEEAADRLRSTAQYLDPFKFTAYSEIIHRPQQPMPENTRSRKGA
ncbi:MBL fold metallo-hydrolase [Roseibium sp.]|uniref:MBL fold metallo-hydrolase n=1 Tax=Roseibium sp. TaxID=1936156 RepID=UPI0039F047D9